MHKERADSDIWLEVQTLKDRMSNLYSALYERIHHPHTKTSELPNLVCTAESVAINILKLEVASITAIQESNRLENQVNTQLPSRSKYKELPKISYVNNNNQIEPKALEVSNFSQNFKSDLTYND